MEIVKAVIEKMKIKEVLGVTFIASILITFMPYDIANTLKLLDFRIKYQSYLTICIILTGSFYLYKIIKYIILFFASKIINDEKVAINYMKKYMSPDEMGLIIQTFYDIKSKRFKSSGNIDLADGRRTPLENKKIIYLASQLGSTYYGFAFNLQPYALEFLNKKLIEGKIVITSEEI